MFQKGDPVEFIDGKYKGRTGIIYRMGSKVFPEWCNVRLDLAGRERVQKEAFVEQKDLQIMVKKKVQAAVRRVKILAGIAEGITGETAGKGAVPGTTIIKLDEPVTYRRKKYEEVQVTDDAFEFITEETATEEPVKQVIPYMPSDVTPLLLSEIDVDPKQPRRQFDQDELNELAQSISNHGVLQPIVVRPVGDRYMLVFGERRFRAARSVQGVYSYRDRIPAFIRDITEEDALELQIIENLQRKDVHPMDEAIAFKRMLDSGKDIPYIANRVGHNTKYVASRLKLNDLLPDLQEMYQMGMIELGNAKLLANADAEVQQDILNSVTDGGKKDWRDWKEGTRVNFYNIEYSVKKAERDLDTAKFNTEDPDLYPERGACNSCPYNSANTPRLFVDSKNMCTQPSCFETKTNLSFVNNLTDLATDPQIVFIVNNSYLGDDDKKRVQLAGDNGIKVIPYSGWDDVPDDPGVADTWEEFYEERRCMSVEDDDTQEEVDDELAELKEEYKDYISDHEAEVREYEKSKDSSAVKAFIVAGDKWGTFKDVVIKEVNQSATVSGPASSALQIAEINVRLKRSAELDGEKVYAKVLTLMADKRKDWITDQPLNNPETVAFAYALYKAIGSGMNLFFEKVGASIRYYSDSEAYKWFQENISPEHFNTMYRLLIQDKISGGQHSSHLKSSSSRAYYDVAVSHFPDDVKLYELDQEGVAERRKNNAQKKIDAIQSPKQEEPVPTSDDGEG